MIAIVGALAVALAAMVMLLACILVRHPTVPSFLKADTTAMLLSLLVTALFATGVTIIAMNTQQAALWQLAMAGIILIAAVTMPFVAFRRLSHYWQSEPPKAPVVDFPGEKKPARRRAATPGSGKRRAA